MNPVTVVPPVEPAAGQEVGAVLLVDDWRFVLGAGIVYVVLYPFFLRSAVAQGRETRARVLTAVLAVAAVVNGLLELSDNRTAGIASLVLSGVLLLLAVLPATILKADRGR